MRLSHQRRFDGTRARIFLAAVATVVPALSAGFLGYFAEAGIRFGASAHAQEGIPANAVESAGGRIVARAEVSEPAAGPDLARAVRAPRRSADRTRDGAAGSDAGVAEVRRVAPVSGGGKHRRRKVTRPPWVGVQSLPPPHAETRELFKEESRPEPNVPWYVADRLHSGLENIGFERPPEYVGYTPRPLFYIESPRESRYAMAVKKVLRKKLFSELRGRAKREWRKAHRSHPRMSYGEYEARLFDINRLGRESDETDLFDQNYYTTELKEDLFSQSYREGESDISLVAWGPFVVTDSGSVRTDLGRLVEFGKLGGDAKNVEIEAGDAKKRPFLATESYRIHTNVRLHFDPFEPVSEGDPTWVIRRYGLAVTIDWLSDVLGKEMISAEFEAEVERSGDFGVALNFMIRSRD